MCGWLQKPQILLLCAGHLLRIVVVPCEAADLGQASGDGLWYIYIDDIEVGVPQSIAFSPPLIPGFLDAFIVGFHVGKKKAEEPGPTPT